jgi:hypothetical protein
MLPFERAMTVGRWRAECNGYLKTVNRLARLSMLEIRDEGLPVAAGLWTAIVSNFFGFMYRVFRRTHEKIFNRVSPEQNPGLPLIKKYRNNK